MTIDLEELKRIAEDGSPGEFEANFGPSVALELIRLLESTRFAAAKEASRCAELERDAARYQWLRNSGLIAAANCGIGIAIPMGQMDESRRLELDRMIDAARANS